MTRRLATALVAIAAACAQPVPANNAPDTSAGAGQSTGNQEQDWAAIGRLEEQARALAIANGCTAAAQCRTAPVGNRACGGPRYYLVYCDATTDSVNLFRKLDEVVSAENAYNRRYQLASTCEFRMPPEIAFSGGECKPATEQSTRP